MSPENFEEIIKFGIVLCGIVLVLGFLFHFTV